MKTLVRSCGTTLLAIMIILPTIGLNPQTMEAMQSTSEMISVSTQETGDASTETEVTFEPVMTEELPSTEPLDVPTPTPPVEEPTVVVAEPSVPPTVEPTATLEPTVEPTATSEPTAEPTIEPTKTAPADTPIETEAPATVPSGDDVVSPTPDSQDTETSTVEATAEITPTETLNNANNSPGTEADLDAEIAVKPDTVVPGETIQVNGYRFEPGRMYRVQLYDDGSEWITLNEGISAGEDETFTLQVVIPENTIPGRYKIMVIANVGDGVFSAPITVVSEKFDPVLSMSPVAGMEGEVVEATGTGFAPDEEVTLWWNEDPYTLPTGELFADRDGGFSAELVVPAELKDGDHAIYARQRDGEIEAKAIFEVLAKPAVATTLSLSPNSGQAGTTSVVTGTGFMPGAMVTVLWGGENGFWIGNNFTDLSGNLSLTITIPPTAQIGTYELYATDWISDPATSDYYVDRLVDPSISLTTIHGQAGTATTVLGTGYQPGETVGIRWDGSTGVLIGLVTVEEDGSFRKTVTVPYSAEIGWWNITATGVSSGQESYEFFWVNSIAAPSIDLSPSYGQANTTTFVTGNGFHPGETVKIYWGGSNGILVGITTASSDGTIAKYITTLRWSQIGSWEVTAIGSSSGQHVTAIYDITALVDPTLSLSPSSGRANTLTVVRGTGFQPGETVEIYWGGWGGTLVGITTAGSDGTIAKTITSLRWSSTGYWDVLATGSSSGQVAFADYYVNALVTPTLTLSPSSGKANTATLVRGTGFEPGETVNIFWGGANGTLVGITTAGSDGSFAKYITSLRWSHEGQWQVIAIGSSSGQRPTAIYNVTAMVTPTLTLSPASGQANTQTVVRGTGFRPGETVNIYWGGASGTLVGITTAGSDGTIAKTITTLRWAHKGQWQVIAIGQLTGQRPTAIYNVTAPATPKITLSPTSGRVNTTTVVSGNNFKPGETLQIYWGGANGVLVGRVTVASNGSFAKSITVYRNSAVGNQSIVARGTSGSQASAVYNVTQSPTANAQLTSTSGPSDKYFYVSGSGFGPYEIVQIMWPNTKEVVGTGYTDRNGKLDYTMVFIPYDTGLGTYTLRVEGEISKKWDTVTYTVTDGFVVKPNPVAQIQLTSYSGDLDKYFYVSGTGFGPDEIVQFVLIGRNEIVATGYSDANGRVDNSLVYLPWDLPDGSYQIMGVGEISKRTGSATYQVISIASQAVPLRIENADFSDIVIRLVA